ncbi:MAG: hypothetical protein J5774_04970 [Clostridia bacterium]|nr:hypothetical protein [Clostridia bacterium]
MDKIRNQSVENLVQVVAKMNSADDVYNFFSDLCTIKELQDMAQRFEMALLLKDGANYQNVAAQVGASSATISRVNRCLVYGNGGYEKAIEIFKKGESK